MKRVFKVTSYKTYTEATWFKKTKETAVGYTQNASVQRHSPTLWLLTTSGLAGLSSEQHSCFTCVLSLRSYGQTLTAAFQTHVGLPSSTTSSDKDTRVDIYFRKCWERKRSSWKKEKTNELLFLLLSLSSLLRACRKKPTRSFTHFAFIVTKWTTYTGHTMQVTKSTKWYSDESFVRQLIMIQ